MHLTFNNDTIPNQASFKHLVVYADRKLLCKIHCEKKKEELQLLFRKLYYGSWITAITESFEQNIVVPNRFPAHLEL